MKQYYYSNGQEQFGPFSFENLKEKNITAETLIWFEGLEKWTSANNISELKSFLELTPPPLITANVEPTQSTPPPLINSVETENKEIKRDFLDELGENENYSSRKNKKGKMNNVLATTLAVIACTLFYFVGFALLMVFDRLVLGLDAGNNGGSLYFVAKQVILIFIIRLIWKKIRSYSK